MNVLAIAALMASCLVAQATMINSYSNWTTVPTTTDNVAYCKTVMLCAGTLSGGSVSRLTDGV